LSRVNGGKQPVPGFSVAFTGDGAHLAQQVAAEITNMFIDENLRQQEQRAQGTNEFLSAQLAEAKRKLDEQNAKLADFKRRNLGALPDEQQTNLQLLGALNAQLTAINDILDRAQQDKTSIQALLNEQMDAWRAAQPGGANDLEALKSQLAKMQDALTVLEGRYTADHPDVIKLKNDVRQMEERVAEEEAAQKEKGPKSTLPGLMPPVIQQLRAHLRQDEDLIKAKTREQEQFSAQIRTLGARIQLSPLVEQQFKELTLGHDTALKFYDDLLTSSNKSQMSADLQSRQQGEQFRILDAPDLPEAPSFPVWWQFALGGLGGGLAVGLSLVMAMEFRDKSIRDERDIEFYLQLPTLALVPTLPGNGRAGKNGKNGRKGTVPPKPVAESPASSTLKL
jgi:protein tyrosine kinase modulator